MSRHSNLALTLLHRLSCIVYKGHVWDVLRTYLGHVSSTPSTSFVNFALPFCGCGCGRERGREGGRGETGGSETERETEQEEHRERVRVCVRAFSCVCVCVCARASWISLSRSDLRIGYTQNLCVKDICGIYEGHM